FLRVVAPCDRHEPEKSFDSLARNDPKPEWLDNRHRRLTHHTRPGHWEGCENRVRISRSFARRARLLSFDQKNCLEDRCQLALKRFQHPQPRGALFKKDKRSRGDERTTHDRSAFTEHRGGSSIWRYDRRLDESGGAAAGANHRHHSIRSEAGGGPV